MSSKAKAPSLFNPPLLAAALKDAFIKLDPRQLLRNPVIFVTEVVAALVTVLWLRDLFGHTGEAGFSGQIAAWLWFTVLFATFAEAVAEGRGKAQAESLRRTKSDLIAKKLASADAPIRAFQSVPATQLKRGDIVVVEAGELIPGDGDIIEGSPRSTKAPSPANRRRSSANPAATARAVTGGTMVLSDWIKVKITSEPGSSFIDRMIALVEGAERQKTPNELALSILLSGLTLVFLITVVTLWGLANYSATALSVVVLVALLVTLIPTTIGGLCRRSASPAWTG